MGEDQQTEMFAWFVESDRPLLPNNHPSEQYADNLKPKINRKEKMVSAAANTIHKRMPTEAFNSMS